MYDLWKAPLHDSFIGLRLPFINSIYIVQYVYIHQTTVIGEYEHIVQYLYIEFINMINKQNKKNTIIL